MVQNSLSFCLSVKLLISPSYLNEILAGYSNLGCRLFSFITLSMSCYSLLEKAMAGGVNYYDTAWGYHNGQSEIVMGEALASYPRDSFYIATKFPGYAYIK